MSMIAISGKPRGGKSLYMVTQMVDYIIRDNRPVVTNLPMVLNEMVRYFCARGLDTVLVYERVQVLDSVQMETFWRYRGMKRDVLPVVTKQEYSPDWLNKVLADQNAKEVASGVVGTLYFLDELHEYLNARTWQKNGAVAIDYAAKHAHMSDDIFWSSQSVANVDSAFRSRTQEYRYFRNKKKETVFGIFNRATVKPFEMSVYLEPRTGAPGQFCAEKKMVSLDFAIAKCYRTSVFGGPADTKDKKKGIPFVWLYVFAIAAALLTVTVAMMGPSMILHRLFPVKVSPVIKPIGASSVVSAPAPVASGVVPLFSAPSIWQERFLSRIGRQIMRTDQATYQAGTMSARGYVLRVNEDSVDIMLADGRKGLVLCVSNSAPIREDSRASFIPVSVPVVPVVPESILPKVDWRGDVGRVPGEGDNGVLSGMARSKDQPHFPTLLPAIDGGGGSSALGSQSSSGSAPRSAPALSPAGSPRVSGSSNPPSKVVTR